MARSLPHRRGYLEHPQKEKGIRQGGEERQGEDRDDRGPKETIGSAEPGLQQTLICHIPEEQHETLLGLLLLLVLRESLPGPSCPQ